MSLEIPTRESLMPIAMSLIVSNKMLTAQEVKFLRSTFDVSQSQICQATDIKTRAYYSRCETGRVKFSSDKIVRIKLFYAVLLKLEGAETYAIINATKNR